MLENPMSVFEITVVLRSPVKKKNLMPSDRERALTPRYSLVVLVHGMIVTCVCLCGCAFRQRMAVRKQQKADDEAEERRKLAARNFQENKQRFKEQQRKKQVCLLELLCCW